MATQWLALQETGAGESEARARRRMAAAGVMAGMLPLVHGHSFAVAMAAGVCLALLFPRRAWLWFLAPALVLAVPQALWMARGTGMQAGRFVAWHLGWDHGEQNVLWFWLRNTGLFIPLLVLAFFWRRGGERLVRAPLARFYVPFALCFVVPNLLQLSPWIWDNVKFLVYWYVASVPIVALVLAGRMAARRGMAAGRVLPVFGLLTLVGGRARRVARRLRAETHMIFDAEAVAFAGRLRELTPPRALVLHVPTYRTPVFLAGRRAARLSRAHLVAGPRRGRPGGRHRPHVRRRPRRARALARARCRLRDVRPRGGRGLRRRRADELPAAPRHGPLPSL